MGISTKTRKILWARSGSKCAICKKELITNEKDKVKDTVVGEECHIISKTNDGPRGNSDTKIKHDECDNLVLLCLEHHKVIDENVKVYPIEKLKEIKNKHEDWVKEKLKKGGERIESIKSLNSLLKDKPHKCVYCGYSFSIIPVIEEGQSYYVKQVVCPKCGNVDEVCKFYEG